MRKRVAGFFMRSLFFGGVYNTAAVTAGTGNFSHCHRLIPAPVGIKSEKEKVELLQKLLDQKKRLALNKKPPAFYNWWFTNLVS